MYLLRELFEVFKHPNPPCQIIVWMSCMGYYDRVALRVELYEVATVVNSQLANLNTLLNMP